MITHQTIKLNNRIFHEKQTWQKICQIKKFCTISSAKKVAYIGNWTPSSNHHWFEVWYLTNVTIQTCAEWEIFHGSSISTGGNFFAEFILHNLFIWQIFCRICLSWKTRIQLFSWLKLRCIWYLSKVNAKLDANLFFLLLQNFFITKQNKMRCTFFLK